MIVRSLEKKAIKFIMGLRRLMDDFVTFGIRPSSVKKAESLEKFLRSFAIADEFTSWKILDVYNEVKISLLKWERFADTGKPESFQLKSFLDSMFAVIEDLYYYEIFGFFSTCLHPRDVLELNLPCCIRVGCVTGWQKEPYLKKDGTAAYENVIRFINNDNHDLLCMTISNEPEILGGREKCVFSDNQVNALKDFVCNNKDIIVLHNSGIIDSEQLIEALKLKSKPEVNPPKYRIKYRVNDFISCGMNDHFVDMNDMPYEEACNFYGKVWNEIRQKKVEKVDYEILSLEIFKSDGDKVLVPYEHR